MDRLPDRVVVISDLHMGVDPDHGMFTSKDALASFVRHLCGAPGKVDLVVLGDSIDYLQVTPYLDFRPGPAKKKTADILAVNAVVFDALRDFLRDPDKRLVWCIGNHDLELLFPEARAVLEEKLTAGLDAAGKARLVLRLEGGRLDYPLPKTGVLRLVHGNKGDPWNRIDYEAVAEVAKSGGSTDFVYPPGSRLVAKVLNKLKENRFEHIDLLKPETTVALPLTLALWPEDTTGYLKDAFPTIFDAAKGTIAATLARVFGGAKPTFGEATFAAGEPAPEPPSLDDVVGWTLREAFSSEGADEADTERDLVSLLEGELGAAEVAEALHQEESSDGTFAGEWARRLISSALNGAAHNANRKSNLWSLEAPDDLDAHVKGSFDNGAIVLVAGHTHLARAVSYRGGFYLNTGTWANLMHIPVYFGGAEFAEHARSLREYLKEPKKAPAALRPFRRLTFVDVRLGSAGGAPFQADLREWVDEPSRLLGSFP